MALGAEGGEFVDATFSPDGRSIVVASGTLAYIWRFDDSSAPRILRGHEKRLTSATFSPNGALVLTASDDGTARLWDVNGQRERCASRAHRTDFQRGVLPRRDACVDGIGRTPPLECGAWTPLKTL